MHMLHSCLLRMSFACLFSDLFPILFMPQLPCHLPSRHHQLTGDTNKRLKGVRIFLPLPLIQAMPPATILPVPWLQLPLNNPSLCSPSSPRGSPLHSSRHHHLPSLFPSSPQWPQVSVRTPSCSFSSSVI